MSQVIKLPNHEATCYINGRFDIVISFDDLALRIDAPFHIHIACHSLADCYHAYYPVDMLVSPRSVLTDNTCHASLFYKSNTKKHLIFVGLHRMSKQTEQVLSLNFNVPNTVTAVRIVLVAVIVWLLIQGEAAGIMTAGILLIVAWATDGLDGFLARRLGQATLAGALFDLVADRLLMTPILILSIAEGLWQRTASLMPLNPYPYAVIVIAADLTVLACIFTFMWKRRNRVIEFPPPTQIARITYSVQMLTLVVGVLGIGPDTFFATLMYLTIIFTLLASYSYLKKGGYVFTC